MKIITLGNSANLLHRLLKDHEVFHFETPLSLKKIQEIGPDLVISFGYRHIVRKELILALKNKIINLHISLLPWNKGADPNFWSWLDDTPKGVSIHLMDEGLDTGALLFQKEVTFEGTETLASSYSILQEEIIKLFEANILNILKLDFVPIPQATGQGSFHKSKDKNIFFAELALGWETKCSDIQLLGKHLSS